MRWFSFATRTRIPIARIQPSPPKPIMSRPGARPKILRPLIFTSISIAGIFTFALSQDIERKQKLKEQSSGIMNLRFSDIISRRKASSAVSMPSSFMQEVEMMWVTLRPAEKTVYGLIGVNALIFAMWQPHRMQAFMYRHFTHDPLSGRSYTLLTSIFSHSDPFHLACNMYVLYGFVGLAHDRLLESREHFLAAYIGAGLISSTASHLYSAFFRSNAFIRPSLGASGALWGIIAILAYAMPGLPVGIIFIPISFKISQLAPILMATDVLGIIRGWQMFDHVAHLGGAIAGYLYGKFGIRQWRDIEKKLLDEK